MLSRRKAIVASLVAFSAVLGVRAQAQAVQDPVIDATIPTPPIAFIAIQPCRLADTRPAAAFPSPFGPPALVGQASRVFPVAGHCGIPTSAQAVSMNIAVTNTAGLGFIAIWPEGAAQPVPLIASLNFSAGQTIDNNVLAGLGTNGGVNVFARVATDLIIDVNGYFDLGAAGARGATGPTGPAGNKRDGEQDERRHGLQPVVAEEPQSRCPRANARGDP